MKFLIFLFLSSVAFAESQPLTDLGPIGNRAVREKFDHYLAGGAECGAVNSGPRILLSGFGLFSGIRFNISGAVIESLQREADLPAVPSGILTASDRGARIVNRELVIGGQRVSACLIILDVQWDFAAAVLVNEMQRFQPDLMIMTGVGGGSAVVEAGALNEVFPAKGFNADGTGNDDNRPVGAKILEDQPLGSTSMTWNQAEMASAARPLIQALGFTLTVPADARRSNDYICNNVSYVALQAGLGHRLTLAGGELVIDPVINQAPPTGFFHYPFSVRFEKQAVQAWSAVLLAMVERGLK